MKSWKEENKPDEITVLSTFLMVWQVNSYSDYILTQNILDIICFNPLTDKQQFNVPQTPTSLQFFSLHIFCSGYKTINWRAARPLIVLHPKQNIWMELK